MVLLSLVLLLLVSFSVTEEPIFPGEEWSSGLIDLGNSGDDIFYILYKCRNRTMQNQRLIVWFQGGPGCSGFLANMVENGPYTYDKTLSLVQNPYGWNEVADLMFVDQPVGSGFSRMKSEATNCLSETCVARNMYNFFVKFVEVYPEYQGKPLYLFGQSYAGQYIPAVGAYLAKANNPLFPLKGVGIGNGVEDFTIQLGTHPTYGYENNLLTFFEAVKQQIDALVCQVNLLTGTLADNSLCLNAFEEMGRKVPNPNDIREPGGYEQIGKLIEFVQRNSTRAQLNVNMRDFVICNGTIYRNFMYDMFYYPLDDLEYLVQKGIDVMLYHGDKDAVCNWRGGMLIAEKLHWDGKKQYNANKFKDVVVDEKVCGTYKRHKNLAFVKIYDAGHFAPYNQPVCTLHLLNWLMNSFH